VNVMTPSPRRGGRSSTRWDVVAIAIVNLINGGMFGSWYPEVPTVAHNLNLTSLHLSWALFGLPAGLAAGALATNWLIRRIGPRWVLGPGILIYSAGMALPGWVHAPVTVSSGVTLALPLMLGLGLAVPGSGNGLVDPSTQSLTNRLEAVTGRLLQPRLQMFLTLGAVVASVAAPVAIRRHVTPRDYLTAVAAIGVLLSIVACVLLAVGHRANPRAKEAKPRYRAGGFVRPGWLIAVCAIAIAGFMGEGIVGDWGGLFAHQEAATALQNAAWTYTTFAISEMAMRYVTEQVVARIGEHRVALVGGVVALLGTGTLVSAHSFTQVLIGAGLLGVGIAPIVPMAFSAVGENTAGVVSVNLAGYLGVSAGPPLIGLLIQVLGWRAALGALAPLAVTTILLSRALRPRLPFAELETRYDSELSDLGRSLARLRVIEDAARRAGKADELARNVSRPTEIRVTVQDGRIAVVPQTASALRRRRRLLAMISYYEITGHVVALEWVRAGAGPDRFVLWEVMGSDSTGRMFDDVDAAIEAFRAALERDWESAWTEVINLELDALPANVGALSRLRQRSALLMAYQPDAQDRPVIECPDAAALERRRSRRATAWALPLPDGEVLVVERVRLCRGAPAALALFDSTQAGQDVRPFEPDLALIIREKLERVKQPYWRRPAAPASS
jgi:MFS family permease